MRTEEFNHIILPMRSDLKANKIPTDVMILDMDWHWNGNAYSQ